MNLSVVTEPRERIFSRPAPFFSLSALLFALFLVPTNFAYLRGEFLPSAVTPRLLLAIVLGAMVLVQWLYTGMRVTIPSKQVWLPFIGFSSLMLFSLPFSHDIEVGTDKFLEFIGFAALAYFAPFIILKTYKKMKCFLSSLVLIGIVMAGLVIVLDPYSQGDAFQMQIGSNYLAIQHMAGMAALVILYFWWPAARGWPRWTAWGILLIVQLVALLYTGGKGSVVMLFVTILFMSALTIRVNHMVLTVSDKRMFVYPIIVGSLGLVIIGVILVRYGSSAFLQRFAFLFTEDHYSAIERLVNLQIAFDLFQQHPVLGSGLGSFAAFASEPLDGSEDVFKYPHNVLIEVLSELGLVGVFVFLNMVLFPLIRVLRLRRGYKGLSLPNVFLSLTLFTLLNAMTSGHIANPALFGFLGICNCLLLRGTFELVRPRESIR